MKKLIYLLLISCSATVLGQSAANNYIKTITPTVELSSIGTENVNDMRIGVEYFDGLGRPLQMLEWSSTPDGHSLFTPFEYDAYGREVKKYLPYDNNTTTQNYDGSWSTNVDSFYDALNDDIANTNTFFSETKFETSPLGRVLEEAAVGDAWKMSTGKTVKYEYGFNNASTEDIKKWVHDDLLVSATSLYASNELYKTTITNENGDKTIEFVDKKGRTILKKSEIGTDWAETYYIYNDRDQLLIVIPPEANERITDFYTEINGYTLVENNLTINTNDSGKRAYAFDVTITLSPGASGSTTLSDGFHGLPMEVLTPEFRAQWCFQYEYDGRGRMTSKQVPGGGKVLMVYDDWDRLVLTQDAIQRAASTPEWLFTKYDKLNRPIMTGIMASSASESTIRSNVAAETDRGETRSSGETNQYTNVTYPNTSLITVTKYLTVTYYDDYDYQAHADWNTLDMDFDDPANPEVLTKQLLVRGQVTGTMTEDGNGGWIKSATYYDDKYRPIQVRTTNHLHADGLDVVTNYFDFVGQVDKTITKHKNGTDSTTITRTFTYDPMGRLKQTLHQVDNNPAKLINRNTYNEIGELIEKDLHDTEQTLNYAYNIRGWLTEINDYSLSGGDLFGMKLYYNTNPLGTTTYHNGNVSAIRWSDQDVNASSVTNRGYSYTYDKLSRLTAASHYENGISKSNFGVSGLQYDLNGNILNLTRNGSSGTAIDILNYHEEDYVGNQLMKVTDTSGSQIGFVDGNTSGNDYTYDANGNMKSDANKSIESIDYNHLNLPTKVKFDASNYIDYQYDAAGIKLQQKVTEGGSVVKTTDYVGEFIYETIGTGSRQLQLIQHEEGRIIYDDYGHDWDYQYHLKDHLGNVRLTFSTLSIDPLVCIETFETGESNGFQDLHRHTNSNANTTAGGDEVELLQANMTGAMVLLAVNKGDTVSMNVKANYESAPSGNTYSQVTGLFTAFDNIYGSGAEGGGVPASSSEFNSALGSFTAKGNSSTAPRAFLNYIFFDLDMNYVKAGFQQISTAALGVGVHETISINDEPIDREGYVLAYLSNENQEPVNVHFDDFYVEQVKTNIVQIDDYYPFGLTFNSSTRTASVPQNFKYNGFEKMSDLGLNLLDYQARYMDPAIGRFIQVDPAADLMRRISTYAYAFNNPVRFIDPDGMMPTVGYGMEPSGVESYEVLAADGTFKSGPSIDQAEIVNLRNLANLVSSILSGDSQQEVDVSPSELQKGEPDKCPHCALATLLRESPLLPGVGAGPALVNPFFKAEAIFGDIGAMLVGGEVDAGQFFILVGEQKGEFIGFTEQAGGVAPEMGVGAELGRVDYTGDISNFSPGMLEGFRRKIWLGAGVGAAGIGLGAVWSRVEGGWIIGISLQAGVGGSTPVSGGYNEGSVELKQRD